MKADSRLPRDYSIRLARAEEIVAIREIERQAATLFADYGLADLFASILTSREELERGVTEERLWLAIAPNDELVGFALCRQLDGRGHLDELDVLPAHGRKGIGTALVETAVSWARGRGYPAITLTTLRQVPWNAPFYQRLGFHILEPPDPPLARLLAAEIAAGLPGEGRVAMARDLTPPSR